MPELDGFGVLEALQSREALRDIPVVVLTARCLNEADMARLNQASCLCWKGRVERTRSLARAPGGAWRAWTGWAALRGDCAQSHGLSARALCRADHARAGWPVTSARARVTWRTVSTRNWASAPHDVPHRYRIRQARALLEAGELNVTEVALSVAFPIRLLLAACSSAKWVYPLVAYRRAASRPR